MSTTEMIDASTDLHEKDTPAPSATLNPDFASFADEIEETPTPQPAVSPDLDDVLKDVPERTWVVKGTLYGKRRQGRAIIDIEEPFERPYVQKPLSYIAMMQFTGLLGRKLDELMADGTVSTSNLPSLMSMPNALSDVIVRDEETGRISLDMDNLAVSQADFSGVDAFVRGFAKLISYAPEVLAEAQCIWLRVPMRERLAVIEIWSRPADEGGLTNDEGEEMLDIFINQNYAELERFLRVRVRRILKRVQMERDRLHPIED